MKRDERQIITRFAVLSIFFESKLYLNGSAGILKNEDRIKHIDNIWVQSYCKARKVNSTLPSITKSYSVTVLTKR